MGPSDYRTYGWWYTILGAGLGVAGLGSLVDTSSPKIYVGALVVGPILLFRGIYFLRRYAEVRPILEQIAKAPPPEGAAELYAGDIWRGVRAKEVTCEACQQEYVYFPGRAAEAQSARLGPEAAHHMGQLALLQGCAVAPCPKCGRIQPEMVKVAGAGGPVTLLLLYAGLLALFGSAILFMHIMVSKSAPPGRGAVDPETIALYWKIEGGLVLVGVGCLIGCWLSARRWNPNRLAVAERHRMARQVSLPRDTYLTLLRARTLEPPREDSEGPP